MTSYLIRRLIQMVAVVLVATMAIYALLNLAPGGPLSGLNQQGDRKARFSEADKARLETYLGLDKPLVLRYLVWLVGEDWLGANYMYVGLNAPDGIRFWAAPGIAYAKGGYAIWVTGQQTGTNDARRPPRLHGNEGVDPSRRGTARQRDRWNHPRGRRSQREGR